MRTKYRAIQSHTEPEVLERPQLLQTTASGLSHLLQNFESGDYYAAEHYPLQDTFRSYGVIFHSETLWANRGSLSRLAEFL